MKRIACRMPLALKTSLHQAIVEDGYGGKGKSRWVREALVQLFEQDSDLANVGVGDDLEINDTEDAFFVSLDNGAAIDAAVDVIRSQYPRAEGVQSSIIRAAVRYRLRKRLKEKSIVTAVTAVN
ncbi:MAG: hypothetical protein KDJ34_19490 [Candidatus Competibacteraceae bacterium]|nr:hypothetical protein [Candidatus Competibacteraceae bacterium]